MKKSKQWANKGLTMDEIKKLNLSEGVVLKVIDTSFALPNKGKVKVTRLEGCYEFIKINKYNTETDSILTLKSEDGSFFTMIGESDQITGLNIKN